MNCSTCNQQQKIKVGLKLIPTNRQDSTYPKFIPQIKLTCAKCDAFIKFAKQTQQAIDWINARLQRLDNFSDLIQEKRDNELSEMKINNSNLSEKRSGRIEAFDEILSLFSRTESEL